MPQFHGVRVTTLSPEQAAEISTILEGDGGQVQVDEGTMPRPDDGKRHAVPLFVWIVFTSVFGTASVVEVAIRIVERFRSSVVLSVDADGALQVTEQKPPRGYLIIKEKDGDITAVKSSVLDVDDLVRTAIESGLGAAAKQAQEAGGTKGEPPADDDSTDGASTAAAG